MSWEDRDIEVKPPAPTGPYHQYNYLQLKQMLMGGDPGSVRNMASSWRRAALKLDRFGKGLNQEIVANKADWTGDAAEMYQYKVWQLAGTAEDAGWCGWKIANGLTKAAEHTEWRQANYPRPQSPLYALQDNPAQLRQMLRYMSEDEYRQVEKQARQDDQRMRDFLHHFDQELGAAAGEVDAHQRHKGYKGPPAGVTGGSAQQPAALDGTGGTSGGGIPDGGGPGGSGVGGTPSVSSSGARGGDLPGLTNDDLSSLGPAGGTDLAGGGLGAGGGSLPGGPGTPSGPGGPGSGSTGAGVGAGGGRGGMPPGGGVVGRGAGAAGGGAPRGNRAPAGPGGALRGGGSAVGAGGAGRGGGGAAGRGGAGRAGMMPMGAAGGSGAGGDDGRSGNRDGWLTEDPDIWGANDGHAAPGVLGYDPLRDEENYPR